jgi:hypothetical protein
MAKCHRVPLDRISYFCRRTGGQTQRLVGDIGRKRADMRYCSVLTDAGPGCILCENVIAVGLTAMYCIGISGGGKVQ